MKHLGLIIAFFLGLALGILGPLGAPKYLLPHLPQSLQGKTETVEGIVTHKQKEADKLLLTVSAPRGATLVTFKDKAKEIGMLVDQQDTITLAVRKYEPFLFDPNVIQVKKPQESRKTEGTTVKPAMAIEGISIPQVPTKEVPPMANETKTEEVAPQSTH